MNRKHDYTSISQFSSGLDSKTDALHKISDWNDIITAFKASCLPKSVVPNTTQGMDHFCKCFTSMDYYLILLPPPLNDF